MKFINVIIISILLVLAFARKRRDPSEDEKMDEEDIIEKQRTIIENAHLNNVSSGICILQRWFPHQRSLCSEKVTTLLSQLDEAYVNNKKYNCKKVEDWLNYGKNAPSVAALKSLKQSNIDAYTSNLKYMKKIKNAFHHITDTKQVADKATDIISKAMKVSTSVLASSNLSEIVGSPIPKIANTLTGVIIDNIVGKIIFKNAVNVAKSTEIGSVDNSLYYRAIAKKIGIQQDLGDGLVILNSICEYLAAQELLIINSDAIAISIEEIDQSKANIIDDSRKKMKMKHKKRKNKKNK